MFDSLLGVRLILMAGQTVPLPVSREVSEAFDRLEVTNDADQGDGFQITFTLAKGSLMEYTVLQSGAVDLFNRVVIGVALGVVPEVLIDGIITHHQLAPSNEPGQSTLTVTGKDVSVMLDLEEKNEPYPNQPDWVIVSTLLGGYAEYGLVPAPTPTTDVPLEIQRVTRQTDTDLKFIQHLAARNGYVFYVEPVTFGVNTAYWGPENRLSVPQSALTIDMGTATNVKQLSFSADGLAHDLIRLQLVALGRIEVFGEHGALYLRGRAHFALEAQVAQLHRHRVGGCREDFQIFVAVLDANVGCVHVENPPHVLVIEKWRRHGRTQFQRHDAFLFPVIRIFQRIGHQHRVALAHDLVNNGGTQLQWGAVVCRSRPSSSGFELSGQAALTFQKDNAVRRHALCHKTAGGLCDLGSVLTRREQLKGPQGFRSA